MPSSCAVGLGSNLGHRLDHLSSAIKKLSAFLTNIKWSTVYETDALLPKGAPDSWDMPYLNMVVIGESSLEPLELLGQLKCIEKEMGRVQSSPRWSPRVIDCDLLYCDDHIIESKHLTLPHPGLLDRFFTAVPAASLTPNWQHPQTKQRLVEIAQTFKPYSSYFKRSMALHPKLMGIVNITPDSFSDGGQFFEPDLAIEQAEKLYQEGAYVIDFGAQSMNPKSKPLSWQEEWKRLAPVLSGFTSKSRDVKVSIDTINFEVAKRAIEQYPIDWINLVYFDAAFFELVQDHKVVLTAATQNDVYSIIPWAEKQINTCLKAGLKKSQLILDPGIGFSKSPIETFQILNKLDELQALGVEILVGHSRKPFWRHCLAEATENTDFSSCIIASHLTDVDYLRVHAVEKHQKALVLSQMMIGK